MRIAVGQIACELGEVAANVRKIRQFTERAREESAEMVIFPEMSDIGYAMPVIRERATSWDEGAVPELRRIAREFSIAIVCGVSEREGESIFNTQVVLDRAGEIIAKYRKTHLFATAPVEEQLCFTAGREIASFSFGEMRCASSICYDLRFPEIFRAQALRQQERISHFISLAVPAGRASAHARARACDREPVLPHPVESCRDGRRSDLLRHFRDPRSFWRGACRCFHR